MLFSVLSVSNDTFTTAMQIKEVKLHLYSQDERKIAIALGSVESNLNFSELWQRVCAQQSERDTAGETEYSTYCFT